MGRNTGSTFRFREKNTVTGELGEEVLFQTQCAFAKTAIDRFESKRFPRGIVVVLKVKDGKEKEVKELDYNKT